MIRKWDQRMKQYAQERPAMLCHTFPLLIVCFSTQKSPSYTCIYTTMTQHQRSERQACQIDTAVICAQSLHRGPSILQLAIMHELYYWRIPMMKMIRKCLHLKVIMILTTMMKILILVIIIYSRISLKISILLWSLYLLSTTFQTFGLPSEVENSSFKFALNVIWWSRRSQQTMPFHNVSWTSHYFQNNYCENFNSTTNNNEIITSNIIINTIPMRLMRQWYLVQ